jgi:hypothetical protein
MTEQIIDATVPTVVGKRFDGHMLRIECPFCKTRKGKGKPIIHVHGTGGEAGIGLPGPWHGHRLAHCNDADLPPELRERRRNSSLSYYIVEVSRTTWSNSFAHPRRASGRRDNRRGRKWMTLRSFRFIRRMSATWGEPDAPGWWE